MRAQFEGMALSLRPIYVGQAIHRAMVEVNEQGTEAAAVTVVTVCLTAKRAPKPRVFQMILDRPFFFAIRLGQTSANLALAQVHADRESAATQ